MGVGSHGEKHHVWITLRVNIFAPTLTKAQKKKQRWGWVWTRPTGHWLKSLHDWTTSNTFQLNLHTQQFTETTAPVWYYWWLHWNEFNNFKKGEQQACIVLDNRWDIILRSKLRKRFVLILDYIYCECTVNRCVLMSSCDYIYFSSGLHKLILCV